MTTHQEALEAFTAYFVKNYPGPDTIIHDPKWHAPRIFRAALHAISTLTADTAGLVERLRDATHITQGDGLAALLDQAAGTIAAQAAENAALKAERDKLRAYAFEATKAITGLTIGGSEFFGKRIGDMYTADLPYCVKHIRERMGYRFDVHREKSRAAAAEARIAALEALVDRAGEALEPFGKQADEFSTDWPDSMVPIVSVPEDDPEDEDSATFTVGHLRTARSTLTAIKETRHGN